MGIELTNGQIYTIYDLEDWWHHSTRQTFEISGPPGSGKTTMIRYFIERIGLDLDDVLFIAYMGKAASQMSRHGLPARTAHSACYLCEKVVSRDEDGKMIFLPNGKVKTEYQFILRDKLPNKPKLIVIDEGFMMPEKNAVDILSFGVPTVVLGDINQLPPVFGKPYFLQNPDAILTEIMRQKEGDPIIYLSQELLKGNDLKEGVYGNSAVMRKENLTDYQLKRADAIITCTNRLRGFVNNLFREKFLDLYSLEYPNYGEKIICRKNNWGKYVKDHGELYLTNGLCGYVDWVSRESYTAKNIKIDFRPDFTTKSFKNLSISIPYITTPPGKNSEIYVPPGTDSFEYAYAITTHLSQGSEYDDVVFLKEDNFFGNKRDYQRLLYTAVTRAKTSIKYVY